jgi:serine protease Do
MNFLLTAPVIILACSILAAPLSRADELGDAVRSAVKVVDPSLVRLRVIGGEQQVDGDTVTSLVTTGVVISENGEILTSLFALEGNPEAILAEDLSGNRANVEVVATDYVRRLVLLKAREGKWQPATAAPVGTVKVGQWSVALGRFYSAKSSSVSVGIVSARNRIHGMAIQSDAKISPVNYGGPLINLQGQVLGILVPLSPRGQGNASSGIEWYDSGIGFAIPLEEALQIAIRLRSGKDLKPGRLGLKLATAGMFSSDIRVERVTPKGPAAIAGLKKKDQLIAVNGRPIERVSILEEVIASSYAGDSVSFEVKRDTETILLTVELVAELPVVTPGYLGLMTIRTARPGNSGGLPDADVISRMLRPGQPPESPPAKPDAAEKTDSAEQSDSVPLVVINETPATKVGLPERIDVLKVNNEKTTSQAELLAAVKDLEAGSVARLEYRIPGATELKTADVKTEEQPERLIRLSNQVLDAVSAAAQPQTAQPIADLPGADAAGDVQRKELTFEGRGRCVVFSSTVPSTVLPGVVILLSTEGISEEQILQSWKPVLDSHKLVVAIPINPEKSLLTADDIPLVMTSIQGITSGSRGDLRRIVIVAGREQSRLAWQMTFGGPSPIRGIALTNGWFSARDTQGADGAGISVLLLEPSQSAQTQALLTQSRDALRKSGFWVARPSDGEAIRTIADWSMLLRSF